MKYSDPRKTCWFNSYLIVDRSTIKIFGTISIFFLAFSTFHINPIQNVNKFQVFRIDNIDSMNQIETYILKYNI